MTRLLYLPDDATLIQLDVEISARQLAAAINAGLRPLPVLTGNPEKLAASQIGNTVVVSPRRKRGHTAPLQHSMLTRRQRQVLELASHGYSNLEIAEMMGISRRTVNYHLNGIKAQMKPEPRPHSPEELQP
jgi:DNA-binding CsgD family transcriptional regulator